MEAQLMEGFGEQVVSAASAARTALSNLNPLSTSKQLLQHLLAWSKRYWLWLVYFIVARKLLRLLTGRGNRKSKRHHSSRSKRGGTTVESVDSSSSNTATTDASTIAPYFSSSTNATSGTNQVIVGDGVIVVNRNDRYVEVYERKNVAKVDNVDDQVEALLKEFASRNRK